MKQNKDQHIIDNYANRGTYHEHRANDLQSAIRDLKSTIYALHTLVCERNAPIRDGINEHNKHTHQLYARIDYLEAINMGLNSDVSRLRMVNALYRKRWNNHEDRQ